MKEGRRILIVDDEESFRTHLARLFIRKGFKVAEASCGSAALDLLWRKQFDIVLLDIVLPDIDGVEVLQKLKECAPESEVIMITGNATVSTAIASMKLGAYDYISKPFDMEELSILVERACEFTRLRRDSRLLHHQLNCQQKFDEFVGKDPAVVAMLALVDKVAPSTSTVLITGETGTGKELIAKAIHRKSQRHKRPFVVVNCSAIQDTLLESEMFGYERGAFTGAIKDKPGLIEVGNTGTIFLDEVGELSPALQIKLLRFLEDGEYRPVGGTRSSRADVRVIAATSRDLKAMMNEGAFRAELFYRLNVINLQLPPLRERRGDIPELVDRFLRKHAARARNGVRKIDDEALECLVRYPWPGNVRELENVIERSVILATGETTSMSELPADLLQSDRKTWRGRGSLASVEREHIVRVLREAEGNKTRAARVLEITKKTLYSKLKGYGIES